MADFDNPHARATIDDLRDSGERVFLFGTACLVLAAVLQLAITRL